jgi:CoA:oxalate CoA-transferase
MAPATTQQLLTGVTVLDLTQFLAGPYGGQIFGDLGARVIKVEPPSGELTRHLPPHFFKGDSAYYLSVNRNKESIALDLKAEQGRELLRELVKKCDIVLESFRPGVAARLSLGYKQLQAVNQRIIVCSLSGFGQDGPYRDRPAYDIIVQALSGGMSLTGPEGGEPVRAGVPIGDLCAGMFAVISTLAALHRMRATGEGCYIDISMLDCQVSMLSYQAAYYLMSGEIPGPQGKRHRSIPTYRAFKCSDGVEIVVAANTEQMWRGLCEAVGAPLLISDSRFLTNENRLANRAALDSHLEGAFGARTSIDIMAELIRLEVPAGTINTLDQVMEDPQVRARGMVLEIADESGSTIRVVGNPVKISNMPRNEPRFPPRLGQDTRTILRELAGLTDAAVSELERKGVVACG